MMLQRKVLMAVFGAGLVVGAFVHGVLNLLVMTN